MGTALKLITAAGRASALLALAWLVPVNAFGAQCGGAVECQCGDEVVESTTLTAHLNGCTDLGLRVTSGTLDCADHQISGPGDPTDTPGIWIDGGSGVTVQNCRVRNFGDGILVDGGTGHSVIGNTVFNNTHGIWVGSGASATLISQNEVHDNQDEGVHLGSGTSGSVVSNNTLDDNDGENLYLISTTDNTITDNVLDQSKYSAIFVKHSTNNTFVDNQILKRTIVIRGDSHGNSFSGTEMGSGGFLIQALEEPDGVWTHPHDTTVSGGEIDASTCFEFHGSYDNTVTDVLVDSCRHSAELDYGGLVPYGNSVSVLDESPADGGDGDGGGSAGSSGRGKVKFNRKRPDEDKLKVSYFFSVPGQISPATEAVTLTLKDADSVVFHVELPAGTLEERSSGYYRFSDKTISIIPGLRELRLRQYGGTLWRLNVKARSELITADQPDMTLSWSIGDDDFETTDTWEAKKQGWKLRN